MSTRSKSGKKASAPAAQPHAPHYEESNHDVVIGVLGDDFSFGGHSLFRARELYEALLHANIAGKNLHENHADARADLIVVPDEVFEKHNGAISAHSVGVSSAVFKRATEVNSRSKFIPLRHLFACWCETDQKKVASYVHAHAPKADHWAKGTVEKFLKGLPPVCFSGSILLDGKQRSHEEIKEILQRIGIRTQNHCATHDAVVLGDKGHGAKYMKNGHNITVINLAQFMAAGSTQADQKFADYIMNQEAAHKYAPAPVTSAHKKPAPAVAKRAASKKRGKSRKSVRGNGDEDTEMVEEDGIFGQDESEMVQEDGIFGEDESGWDRIIF